MTWKADRQAFKNVGRAMRRKDVADFINAHTPGDFKIIPAVASDRLADLTPHFTAGYGVIVFTRSPNTVDVIVLQPGEVSNVPPELLGDTTIGQLVEEMDRLDQLPITARIANRARFTLAA